MTDMESFKQETFALIRQQATKIKSYAREMEIKEEQIRFLKETIDSLEEEKEETDRARNSLKNKLDIVMQEVAQYNDTVVKRIYTENQEINTKLEEAQLELSQTYETLQALTQQLQQTKESNTFLHSQSSDYKQMHEEQRAEAEKLRRENEALRSGVQEGDYKSNKIERENEKLISKLNAANKQVDSMVMKCQETAAAYQKKIKTMREATVEKEELVKCLERLESKDKEMREIRKRMEDLERSVNQTKLENKVVKQKELSLQMKRKVEETLMEADLRNLKESVQLGKRVAEFESQYSDYFNPIFDIVFSHSCLKDETLHKNEILEQRFLDSERSLSLKSELLKESEKEIQLIHDHMRNESQALEASYENKIMQLSIKIKKEEKAIRQLGLREKEFEALNQEYHLLKEDHACLKQTFENTEEQYKKENLKLMQEVRELLDLCDNQLTEKNSMNCLKHTIHNLLAIVHFLHLMILRGREMRRKLFMPFIEFYFRTKNCLKEGKTERKVRKFRKCVWMVIAIGRMRKNRENHYSGIMRYGNRALQSKAKVDELGKYLEDLLERALMNEGDCLHLLNNNKLVYRWLNVPNYLRVNIPEGLLEQILRKKQV